MSNTIKLNCWPGITQCLSWSPLGELAVAAGEHVEILIPYFGKSNTGKVNRQLWSTVRIRTNAFSEEERPRLEPVGFKIWSIGEEISASTILSLAWSPAGIAKHRRAALGILTSNLLLSIWETTSRPEISGSWKRQLIINDVLKAYFQSLGRGQDDHSMTRRYRIRAFAWSPCIGDNNIAQSRQFLAVRNDANEILVLNVRLQPDFLPLNGLKTAPGSVVMHFRINEAEEGRNKVLAQTFDDVVSQSPSTPHLAWSPCLRHDDGAWKSILAYTTNTQVFVREMLDSSNLESSQDARTAGTETSYPVAVNDDAPFCWFPKPSDHGLLQLVTFTNDCKTVCISVNAREPLELANIYEHQFKDDYWDSLSGITFAARSNQEAHFSFLTSTVTLAEPVLMLPGLCLPEGRDIPPDWQKQLLEDHALYSAEYDLAGNVVSKVWGLCSSPMGDLIASCVTRHPNNQVEYTISSEQFSWIEINQACDGGDGEFYLPVRGGISPAQEVHAEAILVSLMRWLHLRIAPDESEFPYTSVLDQLVAASHAEDSLDEGFAHQEQTREGATSIQTERGLTTTEKLAIARSLHTTMFRKQALARLRCRRILSIALADDKPGDHAKPLIQALLKEIRGLPATWRGSALSQRIFRIYECAESIITKDQSRIEEQECTNEIESCEICEGSIKFDNLSFARCSGGHQFARCSITFLAIQAPRISRFCGICGAQSLTKEYLTTLDRQDRGAAAGGDANNQSLIDILMMVFNSCMYCGGKYVG